MEVGEHGDPGPLFVGIGKQHRKFVSAKADQQVSLAKRTLHQTSHRLKSLITFIMPKAIVDILKVV